MKNKLKPLRSSSSRPRTSTSSDPLSQIVAAQLATETPQARELRLQAENEARDASIRIDHSLEQDRRLRHLGQGAIGLPPNQYTSPRTRRVLLLLLLGPSNAGKTTFANQMRMTFDPDTVALEAEVHRLAMLLSIVASVKILLNFLNVAREQRADQNLHDMLFDAEQRLGGLIELEPPLRSMLGTTNSASFRDFALSDPSVSDPDEMAGLADESSRALAIRSWSRAAESVADWRTKHAESSPCILTNGTSFRFPTLEEGGDDIASLWGRLTDMGLVSGPAGLSDSRASDDDPHPVYLFSDSAQYYLREARRITAPDYRATEDDVLHLRVATVGAQEHLLACTEELLYRVVDLSGARGAVRNWARFFDQADAILFIVDSSSYNVPSAVNRDSNKLADALALFTETVSHPLLSRIGLLVFFNKNSYSDDEKEVEAITTTVDLLRAKLKHYPMSKYFADFSGVDNSYHPAKDYIKQRFIRGARNDGKSRFMYTHYLQATNSRSTRLTINALQDLLVKRNFEGVGLM